jgi:hypothetical protein
MEGEMRIIGMDIHRVAAEIVALLEGHLTKLGRIPMTRDSLETFARKEFTHDDHVVVEATGNAAAVVEVHRADHAMVRHQPLELLACVLAAAIRMMQQSIGLASPPDRHQQRIGDELRRHACAH